MYSGYQAQNGWLKYRGTGRMSRNRNGRPTKSFNEDWYSTLTRLWGKKSWSVSQKTSESRFTVCVGEKKISISRPRAPRLCRDSNSTKTARRLAIRKWARWCGMTCKGKIVRRIRLANNLYVTSPKNFWRRWN